MASERKVVANRKNARRSTGPSSADGKRRTSQNARSHGLSVPSYLDESLSSEIEDLAALIYGDSIIEREKAHARRVAEAQMDIIRVRQVRQDLFTHAIAKDPYLTRFFFTEEMQDMVSWLMQRSDRSLFQNKRRPTLPVKFALILSDLFGELTALERYEKRAVSRRKFAIRELDAARLERAK